MRTAKNSSRSTGLKTIHKLIAAGLFVIILMGCSKDDGPGEALVNKVTITSMSPQSPATLKFDEDVTITYSYEIGDPNGARIWVQPYSNGAITPKYSYTSSPLFKGNGTRTVKISVSSGDNTIVDQLNVEIADANGQETISESFQTVDYTFTN